MSNENEGGIKTLKTTEERIVELAYNVLLYKLDENAVYAVKTPASKADPIPSVKLFLVSGTGKEERLIPVDKVEEDFEFLGQASNNVKDPAVFASLFNIVNQMNGVMSQFVKAAQPKPPQFQNGLFNK